MDIDQLTKTISDIILTKDEVTLPGLGSFVAEEVPASFSDKGFTINPPYRRLSFRPYQGNDNYLAESFAKSNNIPVEEAGRQLTDFLQRLKEVLKQRKSIIFPGLGHLRATKENNFFFVSNEDIMIYPEGFGLQPVSLKSHNHTTLEQEKQAQNEALLQLQPKSAEDTTPEPEAQAGHVFLKVFLAILVIAILAIAALFILSEFAPDLLDKLLYTEEELKILHY